MHQEKIEEPAEEEIVEKTLPDSLSLEPEQHNSIEADIKAETDRLSAGKRKTTSDYLKEKAREAAGVKKEQTKPEEDFDKEQDNQEDKKEAAADAQPEEEKTPEQEQQKPPSGSPENKP